MAQNLRVKVGSHQLDLTNLTKVMYPATGFTKAQVLEYYARIGPAMVPHLKGRPLNLKRFPNGVDGEFFYQKQCPPHPGWVKTASVWSDTRGAPIVYCTVNDVASLVWLANTANLEFHTLLYTYPDLERPTTMVFDLDPGQGAGLVECGQVAALVRDHLAHLGLSCVQKVSGGKGLQLYVPLNTDVDFEATRALSKAIAEDLQAKHPDLVTSNMRKVLRKGRVLVDWSQNNPHKSTVCVYSLRAQQEPSVATPVTWDEVEDMVAREDPSLLRFGPEEVLERVRVHGDLFKDVLRKKQTLPTGARPSRPAASKRAESTRPKPRKGTAKREPGRQVAKSAS
jgi:bifunctional non-homologous end joining protein LigD